MATQLQVRLSRLSAPGQLVDWAQPYADLQSCWNACTDPEFMLWLAARLSTTAADRRAVICCLAELTRSAERGHDDADPVGQAAGTAETWARTGAGLADVLAAERAALDAAARAAVVAGEQAARARRLLRSAPRRRGASFGGSRALGAVGDWRQAERERRLALAAARTAHAAAEAARAEAAPPSLAQAVPAQAAPEQAAGNGPVPAPSGPGQSDAASPAPGDWAACVGESASYAVSALAPGRATRKAARLVRSRLPCPSLG